MIFTYPQIWGHRFSSEFTDANLSARELQMELSLLQFQTTMTLTRYSIIAHP